MLELVSIQVATCGGIFPEEQDQNILFLQTDLQLLCSGSLWIGGLDVNQQLKLAALRYRQVGLDYWAGPLTTDGAASVDAETCAEWDQHYVVTREEIDQFIQYNNSEKQKQRNFLTMQFLNLSKIILLTVEWIKTRVITWLLSMIWEMMVNTTGKKEIIPIMI